MDDPSTLVSALETETDGGVRVVAEYSDEGYNIQYARDDVQPKIADIDTERIHNELVLQGIGKEYLEQLFDAGHLHCSVHRFDELTAFHFVRTEAAGGYVSVDSDAPVQFESFVETCRAHL